VSERKKVRTSIKLAGSAQMQESTPRAVKRETP
jgi:hypothetical protein